MATMDIAPIVERNLNVRAFEKQCQPEIAVLYITERVLVLTFQGSSMRTEDSIVPSEENAYRASLRHVSRMLRTKHADNYKIFNLSRRRRDLCQYNRYVVEYGWPLHQAPPLERLCSLCKDLDGWLNRAAENIVVLHEKSGANRAAMVVAVFMHYCSISASDNQALDRFAMRKFYNEHRMRPSQRRYVSYFSGLLSGQIKINSCPIYLYQVVIYGLPVGSRPYLKFYEKMVPVLTTGAYEVRHAVLTARLKPPLAVRGDVLIKCCETAPSTTPNWQQQERRPIVLFTCQFNTCAVDPHATPCLSFSARELDLHTNEEAGLDLLYSFDKDFQPVGTLATVIQEDTSATLAYRANSYDRFDRFTEDDVPTSSENEWTGQSVPLTNGSSTHKENTVNFPILQHQRAPFGSPSSANETTDSGIHSVFDGDSSCIGSSNVENVVVEAQAKRAELLDWKASDIGRNNQQYSTMENVSDVTANEMDRILDTAAKAAKVLDTGDRNRVEKTTLQGHSSGMTTPLALDNISETTESVSRDFDGAQIEFPHRPLPLTAPSRRPFSPQQSPLSPGASGYGANFTQHGKEIDAELVEEGRYDPQSKAFSYVPAKSLEDHFKSPKHLTKLVLKTERTPGAETGAQSAPLPLTDNDLADLETATISTQYERQPVEKRSSVMQQRPPSTGSQTPQRKRSTSRSRTPLTTEDFDELLNPDFYLNFQGQGQPSVQHQQQKQQPPTVKSRPDQPPLVMPKIKQQQQQRQWQPKSQFSAVSAPPERKLPPDAATVLQELMEYSMQNAGNTGSGQKEMTRPTRQDLPHGTSSVDDSSAGEYQRPMKVPPHLDTRRDWEPTKRAYGAHKEDDVRWDRVFDDFEKRFIKYPEPKPRPASTSARPWTTAPPTPVLSTRSQHDSLLLAVDPSYMGGLPVRPSTAMGFQSGYNDDSPQSTLGGHPDSIRKAGSIPDDPTVGHSPLAPGRRMRSQSGDSGVDWLSHQMEKLKYRKEMNDPILRQRREQERRLLNELRHVNEDQKTQRSQAEAAYTVEGVGERDIEPGSEEDEWMKQQAQRQQQQLPPHLLSRPESEQHAPPPLNRPVQAVEQDVAGSSPWATPYSQTTALSINPKAISSPRSILKKPKPSPVGSQQYGSAATTPNFYSQRPPSPYSTNGFSDADGESTASRVFDLEPVEIEPVDSAPFGLQQQSHNRPTTPGFPVRMETPLPYHPYLYSGAEREPRTPPVARAYTSNLAGVRSPSPASQYYGQSRRSSMTSLLEPMDVVHHHPVFVKDTSKYWYKPHISRDEAIEMLKDKSPGTFIIRDSNSFAGAFGLALKVATPPPGVQTKTNDGSELVRHFLIEPTAKGVKLKGCNNEPVFGTLAALVYQHSITPLALPTKLVLPEFDPAATQDQIGSAQALLEQGAACNVTYLHTCDTESLTGPEAVRRAVDQALYAAQQKQLTPVSVHFKVSTQGITVTDNTRKLFFRRHYLVNAVTFCGLDPEERRWTVQGNVPVRIFGFVARKAGSQTDNACHIFAELEPEQPATAIVNFITKVMMASCHRHQKQSHHPAE